MREIKFRGKKVDSQTWVYGTPVFYKNGDVCIFNDSCVGYGYEATRIFTMRDQVDPTTVSQFTGLHDKGGKEIYEGDIVCFGSGSKLIVEWATRLFCGQQIVEVGWMLRSTDNDNKLCNLLDIEYSEVIGNIFENADLLT